MSKYRVTLTSTASITVYVEAEDKEEAIEAAFEQAPYEVCHQCSGYNENYNLELGEWDFPEQDWAAVEV